MITRLEVEFVMGQGVGSQEPNSGLQYPRVVEPGTISPGVLSYFSYAPAITTYPLRLAEQTNT